MSLSPASFAYVDPAYLDAAAREVGALKAHTYELLALREGSRVLDIGSGPGHDTLAMAARVGASGEVFGVDADPEMVAEAERRATEAGLAARVHHVHARATALPFTSASLDACRSERVFHHLEDAEAATAEAHRVLRPGGIFVLSDVDVSSLSVDVPVNADIDWKFRRARTEMFANGFSGRRLSRYLSRAGFDGLKVEIHAFHLRQYAVGRYFGEFDKAEDYAVRTGALTVDEVAAWRAANEAAEARGEWFGYMSVVVVAARAV